MDKFEALNKRTKKNSAQSFTDVAKKVILFHILKEILSFVQTLINISADDSISRLCIMLESIRCLRYAWYVLCVVFL